MPYVKNFLLLKVKILNFLISSKKIKYLRPEDVAHAHISVGLRGGGGNIAADFA